MTQSQGVTEWTSPQVRKWVRRSPTQMAEGRRQKAEGSPFSRLKSRLTGKVKMLLSSSPSACYVTLFTAPVERAGQPGAKYASKGWCK